MLLQFLLLMVYQLATAKDPILMRVYHYVLEGWPQGVQKRDQLSSDQGCILWGIG